MPLSEIIRYAGYFTDMERINVTGGEPSFHRNFAEFSSKIRKIFPYQKVTIETNGYGKLSNYLNYDRVFVTEYSDRTYKGCLSNAKEIAELRQVLMDKLTIVRSKHRVKGKHGKPCFRGKSETVAFFGGLIYPCCSAMGAPGAVGIVPTDNWQEDILKVKLPCKRCVFSK